MSHPAIIVENLSKKFRLGTGGGPGYHRLSEAAAGIPRALYNSARSLFPTGSTPLNSTTDPSSLTPETCHLKPSPDFWALRDVSFEIQPGEVVGIIGRNGAGKSTLLKILSRITEPTSGRFGVRGRVASLLEVGTGFHPELTGRENIYVSGITLGMTRAEIKKRFDEIVDFSGVEKFLDTPVKHYSSGMQVRLGFAVAAHLESEILIVDEVLAVGDAEFQKKCVSKLSGKDTNKTIVVVSHDLSVIRRLCGMVAVMNEGNIQHFGQADAMIALYQRVRGFEQFRVPTRPNRNGLSIQNCMIQDDEGNAIECILFRQHFSILISVKGDSPFASVGITLQIRDRLGTLVASICNAAEAIGWLRILGMGMLTAAIENFSLLPGDYTVDVLIHSEVDAYPLLDEPGILSFSVVTRAITGAPLPYKGSHGVFRVECKLTWQSDENGLSTRRHSHL